MAISSTTVTVRLSSDDAERLKALAKKRGVPPSEVARDAILKELEGEAPEGFGEKLSVLKEDVSDLKEALCQSVKVLLLTSERISKEKVREFIEKTFGD